MPKLVYHYAPDTGLFVGATAAEESPLEPGVHLIPAFATEVAPPSTHEREALVFIGGSWTTVPDWRGAALYSKETGQRAQLDQVGILPDDVGLTVLCPPRAQDREAAVFRGGAWALVPDWRDVCLYSTADGAPVVITELGQNPADVGATDHPRPSPAHVWQGDSWQLDPAKQAEQLDLAKLQALATIDRFHAATVQKLVGNPTQVEKDTWALKLEVASAVSAEAPISAAGQAFLTCAGLATDAARSAWAASVLAKSAAYAQVVGLAEKLRETARVAVKTAADEASLKTALDAQRAAADAAVAGLLQKT